MKRLLAACAALLVAAGCAAEPAAGPADPASLAPQNTLAFASIQTDAIPGVDLGRVFTRVTRTSSSLDYEADVKPWLGDTLAVVMTRAGRRDGDFAVLAESTDDDKARAAIEKDLTGSSPQSAEYRGVDYELLDRRFANGIVDHYLVAGTEAAFKAVVDASKDDTSLLDSEQWKTTVGDRGAGKEGVAFVDAKALLQSLAADLPGPARVALPLLLGTLDLRPFVATLDAGGRSLVVDVASPGTKPDPRGPAAASSELIESLPASAWFALAVPDVGPALGQVVAALEANPLIAAPLEGFARRFEDRTGLDLERDVIGAVGDIALFALGNGPRKAGGAVIETARPAALAKALRRLPRMRGGRLRVIERADRVVALHRARALPTGAELGQTPLFAKARQAIGERPTMVVDVRQAARHAAKMRRRGGRAANRRGSAHGGAGANLGRRPAPFRRMMRKLRRIEFVAAGARREGNLDVLRLVVGLR